MITELKPYAAYRSIGVPWLGQVPTHWELRRTKTLLAQRIEKGFPQEPLLAATQSKGVVRKEEYEARTVLAMKDLHLLKLVHTGDFVISLRSFQGGIEYARERGIISPAYTVLYPVAQNHHAYLARLFKSESYIHNLSLFVTGIRQGQNIDYERLARSYVPLPPLADRTAIVRFLDHADRRIRRYIRAKAEADCAAGGAEAGHHPRGRHGPDRRPNRPAVPGLQALRSGVAGGGAGSLDHQKTRTNCNGIQRCDAE